LERRILPYLTTFLVVTASACGREAEQRAQAAEAKLAQMNEITAAKDSLTREMMATTTFMTQLNDELAKVKTTNGNKTAVVGETVVPLEEYRAGMITKIKDLRNRLDENEKRLASTSERLRKLSAGNKELSNQIAAYDTMVAGYKRIMDDQRTQISVLTNNIDALQKKNQLLSDENTHLTGRVTEMTTFANTVYYVLGTKKELMEKGVVNEIGGSRVLGIGWRTGETLVPGANLNETLFTRSTKQDVTEIALPDPTKKYRLVSPQNVNSLATKPGKDGKFTGSSIKIADPESFWAPSKYLILVEG
jgi:myosin heavy subunit